MLYLDKASCIESTVIERLFRHVKDEFWCGREWKTFEDFKRDLEEYIVYWITRLRRLRLKGLVVILGVQVFLDVTRIFQGDLHVFP